MSKQQIYVSFNSGEYRVFRSYETIVVNDDDATVIKARCINPDTPDRTLLFNKGAVKFIDVGPVQDDS